MPIIKPRLRGKQMVRRIVRLDRETNEVLFAYAHFLGESTDYVLNEVIDTVLARDKDFQSWRAEHFLVLVYAYATLWFSTPFCLASLLTSLSRSSSFRRAPHESYRPLPRYPEPEERPAPSLVLGEVHHVDRPGRAPDPQWLVIPQRGLYTGLMVLGAVGTGKTSACMYPYVDQLLRWRAQDADHKLGALVMEVKGDFCLQVRSMLKRAGRADDYVEIGSTRASATTRCTTISIRMPWPTRLPRSSTTCSGSPRSRSGSRRIRTF
jgi:hypothetical protein